MTGESRGCSRAAAPVCGFSRGTYLSSFFIFPICFQCQMTIEWSTLSSWATSCVAIRGSASVISNQLIVVSFWCSATTLLIFKALISFAKLLEPPLHCMFVSDWFDLVAVQGTLKSLLQHHSSKVSILQHSAFFMVQLSHPYMTTGKTIALTR